MFSVGPLPPAIQALVPVLEADQGRARAKTLLFIATLDPVTVEEQIDAIHAAMGTASPGIDGLSELVSRAKQACSIAAPVVHEQHLVSRVVLRQFCELVDARAGQQLVLWDLDNATSKLTGPGGAGFLTDFVKIDSKATEELWQAVENNLGVAIASAQDGTLFSRPDLVATVRDAIALHFARSHQVRDVHYSVGENVYQRAVTEVAASPISVEAFQRAHGGIVPAGPEGRRLGAESFLGDFKQRFDEGTLFRLRVEDLFDTVRDRFASSGLEILVPSSSSNEFLVGDTPALAVNLKNRAAGIVEGVGLANADTVVLPLAPRLAAALGPADVIGTVPDSWVDALNALQVRLARRYVHNRPRTDFAARIKAWR